MSDRLSRQRPTKRPQGRVQRPQPSGDVAWGQPIPPPTSEPEPLPAPKPKAKGPKKD